MRYRLMTAILITAVIVFGFIFVDRRLANGYIILTQRNTVSFCTAEIEGKKMLLAITAEKRAPGGAYGDRLTIMEYYGNIYGLHKIINSFDFKDLQPSKVLAGDINGDGLPEIGVCVYKATTFHQVLEKRPFFYSLRNGNLVPIWLGSRLSRPFTDYILHDIDGDGTDNIIAIELTASGGFAVSAYAWAGFGFEQIAESAVHENIFNLRAADNSVIMKIEVNGINETVELIYDQGEILFEKR